MTKAIKSLCVSGIYRKCLYANQASLKVCCACEHSSETNVPPGKMDCNRLSLIDFEEKCLQKFEVWHFVSVSNAHR